MKAIFAYQKKVKVLSVLKESNRWRPEALILKRIDDGGREEKEEEGEEEVEEEEQKVKKVLWYPFNEFDASFIQLQIESIFG